MFQPQEMTYLLPWCKKLHVYISCQNTVQPTVGFFAQIVTTISHQNTVDRILHKYLHMHAFPAKLVNEAATTWTSGAFSISSFCCSFVLLLSDLITLPPKESYLNQSCRPLRFQDRCPYVI